MGRNALAHAHLIHFTSGCTRSLGLCRKNPNISLTAPKKFAARLNNVRPIRANRVSTNQGSHSGEKPMSTRPDDVTAILNSNGRR